MKGQIIPMEANGSAEVNGNHIANSNRDDSAGPLRVIIVGAGIGGLTAGIALRQQGHRVQIFEQSRFACEVGAAVHLAPNANGILRRLGIYADACGANLMNKLTEFDSKGQLKRDLDLREENKMWQHPWLLAHRVHLHEALKTAATSPKGKGTPVELLTGRQVVAVDEYQARVTLASGEVVQGDVVVGADGVHSVTRRRIVGEDLKPFGCGKSAFRFLIPRQSAKEDPETSRFANEEGQLIIWYSDDRRIVMYPTSNNELLNFVCIHPEIESNAGADWNQESSLQTMLKVYESFDAAVVKLISKADPNTLKVWKLLDMDEIPKWYKGRLLLLGDAAHPFLPHQGQGAGSAIEDAAALSTVLPLGTTKDELEERLGLYDDIRHERATRIQQYSRLIGSDNKEKEQLDMVQFTYYNFGHDEFDNSQQRFREFQWSKIPKKYSRMPISFGPMPGPRQDHYGNPRNSEHSTFTTASIRFKTSRTALQNLFPPGRTGYRFKNPGTVAYASFSQTTLNQMEWLGGSGYNHLGLYIHGVEYVKSDGSIISGTFMPILFESLTDPIVSGREELGMPKLYSAIDIFRRSNSYHVKCSWQGAVWGNFSLGELKEVDPQREAGTLSGEADAGIMVHRYIPSVGRSNKGQAEADYCCFVPFAEDSPPPRAKRVWKSNNAKFEIDSLSWDELPTLHHIIGRLSEIPVYEVMGGKLVEGTGVPDVSNCRPA